MNDHKYLMSSLNNALLVLDQLAEHDNSSIAELAKITGMGKTSLFKILYTFERNGYVYKSEDARYGLSTKLVRFGDIVLDRVDLISIAAAEVKRLRDRFNETVHLSICTPDNQHVMFVLKERSLATISMRSRVGMQLPIYCTASGKAMLANMPGEEVQRVLSLIKFEKFTPNTITDRAEMEAELDRTRARGYAIDNEESEEGLMCFGVRIRDPNDCVKGAISMSVPRSRGQANIALYSEAVMEAAQLISAKYGCGKGMKKDQAT